MASDIARLIDYVALLDPPSPPLSPGQCAGRRLFLPHRAGGLHFVHLDPPPPPSARTQDGVSSYRIALVASDIVRLIDHVTGSAPGCGRAKLLVGHDWCAHTSA